MSKEGDCHFFGLVRKILVSFGREEVNLLLARFAC